MERRKVGWQIRCERLPEMIQIYQTLELVLAHIAECDLFGQCTTYQLSGRIGKQDLPAICYRHDPLNFCQCQVTTIIMPGYFGSSGMQPHTDFDRCWIPGFRY